MNQKPKHIAPTPISKAPAYGYEAYSSSTNKALYVKGSKLGYTYFGARYYASDLSVWLSVDPLATIYPMLSPYAYVANNPILYYDPDGKIIALVVTSMANEGFFNAGPKGHMAIIVGNDEIGYHLFSLEGPKGPYKNYASKSKDSEKFGDVLFPESLLSKQYVYYQHSESSLEALYEYMGNNAPGTFNKKKIGNGYDRILALNDVTSEQEAAFLKFMEGQSTEDFTYEFATNNCSSFSMNSINNFFGNIINDKTAIDIPNREFDKLSRDTKNWTVIRDAKQPQMPSNIELSKEKLILGSEGYGH